jgi:uncharacterized coiled-coil protein SlyX
MREYPHIYSQRDPQWAGQRLGTVDGATIGQYGCLLSCHAMKAGYYGHEIKPNALDDIYTNRKLYVSGDLLSDADLHVVFDDIQLIDSRSYSSGPADLNYLKQLAQDPTLTVTIEVDFDHDPKDGIQTHFVELHDFDGVTLTIYDPWYGQPDNFATHYGTNPAVTIQKFAVYKGNPTKAQMPIDQDLFTKLVKNSSAYDAVCDELGIPHDSDKALAIAEIAKLKSSKVTAEQTISTLNQQLPELRTTNETLTGQIKTLTQNIEDSEKAAIEPTSGKLYKDLYNQAEFDLIEKGKSLGALQQTYNRAIAQYQNTSALLIDKGQLIRIAIARILNLPLEVIKGGTKN